MGRLIDEQTAYDVLTEYYHHWADLQHKALEEALSKVPTVDAVPVRHGRWINEGVYGEGHSQCSIRCSNPLCNFHYIGYLDDYNYCPNCGAKMDGKDGGNG
jgi:hypothetical protein